MSDPADEGGLALERARIVFAFRHRPMVGSDARASELWDGAMTSAPRTDAGCSSFREPAASLPREVAEKTAHGTAAWLFGREISIDRVGTR